MVTKSDRWAQGALGALPYISLLGFVVLVGNVALSFEEPHTPMLLVSVLLIFVAPAGLLLHLVTTSELTPHEKALWWRGLGRGNSRLFAAYFSKAERQAATRSLVASRESA